MWKFFSRLISNLHILVDILVDMIRYSIEKFTHVKKRREDERSIEGFLAIVTGSNSGIGKETAYELAIRKAKVILACRNMREGQKAIDDLQSRAINQSIGFRLDFTLMELDLSSFNSVRKFVSVIKEYLASSPGSYIDLLVNNAGIMDTSGKLVKCEDGYETHLTVNYLSQALLTNLLLDFMRADSTDRGSRIINVTSSFFIFGPKLADRNDLMLKSGRMKSRSFLHLGPYGLSKYYMTLHMTELSKRVEKEIYIYNACPGLVDTGIFRNMSWIKESLISIALAIYGISPKQGAEVIVYLCTEPKAPPTGKFYRFNKIHRAFNRLIKKKTMIGRRLWAQNEQLVKM